VAVNVLHGVLVFDLLASNIWVCRYFIAAGTNAFYGGGAISVGGTLDGIRLTTVGGTDTFDAGSAAISWET
jgi:hypothetical protein